ncbi:MAG: PRC-barrel domain-containing protein [Steroidobacteraceae bacterium]|jgi:hypothetical protein
MLRSTKDLLDYTVRATDGDIGHVRDFYFDDQSWVARYLIVETGGWLESRKVLISPIAIGHPDWSARVLPVSITKEQVRNSPDIDTDRPVSRQHEMQYLGYYGYPYYWGGAGLWGEGAYPGILFTGPGSSRSAAEYPDEEAQGQSNESDPSQHDGDDRHLRSAKDVMRYHIEASDGGIGHVESLLIDEDSWAIRYLVVDTSNWWLGHQVLIAPRRIRKVSWPDATVSVNLTQQAVKDAPPYDASKQLDLEQEIAVYEHYERAGYRPQPHARGSGRAGEGPLP